MESLFSAVELINGIATNFEQADQWLGNQLQNGQFVGKIPAPVVPADYKAYLDRDQIFDDVKDVLQAFDRQVEQRSGEYARKVAEVYQITLGEFEHGLDKWHTHAIKLRDNVKQITDNYHLDIQVKEERIEQKLIGNELTTETIYETRYWGTLEQLYSSETLEVIGELKSKIIPKIDSIQQAIWQSEKIKGSVQYLDSILKPIIEEGVYTAFDLDEIVQGQKRVLEFARRLGQEIGHVAEVIQGEGMASHSIETLQQKLQETQRLVNYYAEFVGECFGDNEASGEVAIDAFSRF